MKIAYINGSRIPTEKAHGLQIVKMCGAFAHSGVAVELWVPRRLNHIKQDAFEYYGSERIFKIKRIPCVDFIIFDKVLGPLAFWITELSFILFVMCYLLRNKADIIYTRDKFVVLLLSIFKKNVFYEAHTVPASLFFAGFKRARGVITITHHLTEIFVGHGAKENKIFVAPDGVDVSEFEILATKEECREKLSLPQDRRIVLYTGHLYNWKGADTLLEAAKFSIFNFQFSNVLFIFVGGTEKDVKNFRKQSNGLDNVRVVGHRPHNEIPYWLKAADVLVLPNSGKYDISKYWTSPMKLFEYMASGRPIVASDLPSIREILNKTNSLLVKEADNPKELARGIKYMLYNKDRARELAVNALDSVRAYTWEKRAENILKFINHINK